MFVLSQSDFCSPAWWWMASCKGRGNSLQKDLPHFLYIFSKLFFKIIILPQILWSFQCILHSSWWLCFFYYSGTPPYDHPVYKTTSLLRPYSFKPNVKTIKSFSYIEDPVNATTSLLRPGFYGPTVVALTGFHCTIFFCIIMASRIGALIRLSWETFVGRLNIKIKMCQPIYLILGFILGSMYGYHYSV